METRALLSLTTSSSYATDSQEQNPILHIWHSTNPTQLSGSLSVTALPESNKTVSQHYRKMQSHSEERQLEKQEKGKRIQCTRHQGRDQ